MDLCDDERSILVQMIQIEDHGNGGYRSDPDLRQRLHDKGLERHGVATELARKILNMPKPEPSASEIAALKLWVNEHRSTGWELSALNRRGLIDAFGHITDRGRKAIGPEQTGDA